MLDDLLTEILAEVNNVREDPVVPGSCLRAHAQNWAERVARTGSTEHRNPRVVLRRCNKAWAGEVIARSHTALDPAEVIEAWLDSKQHRDVVLKPRASRAGVGTAKSHGWYVVVIDFGDAA